MSSSYSTWSYLLLCCVFVFHVFCTSLPVGDIFAVSYTDTSPQPVLECGPLVVRTFDNMKEKKMLSSKKEERAFQLHIPFTPPHLFFAEKRANLVSNQTYAVKEIPTLMEEDTKDFKRQLEILAILNNQGFTPNILCYFTSGASSYYVMPLIEGAFTLKETLLFYNPLKENLYIKWANLCIHLVQLVQQLHARKVVHLNLNRESFLVRPDGRLFIVGFSKARKLKLLHSSSDAVLVPEIKENARNYSELSDVYLLGFVFYSIYNSMREVLRAVALYTNDRPNLKEIAENVATSPPDLIFKGMTNSDPAKRVSTDQVLDMLFAFKLNPEKYFI